MYKRNIFTTKQRDLIFLLGLILCISRTFLNVQKRSFNNTRAFLGAYLHPPFLSLLAPNLEHSITKVPTPTKIKMKSAHQRLVLLEAPAGSADPVVVANIQREL